MSREKWKWSIATILIVGGFVLFFGMNQYVGFAQHFGPVPPSSLGRSPPFSQVVIKLECGSEDGSYVSDLSDVYCKILVKSLGPSIIEMDFSVVIMNLDNQTLINCISSVRGINTWFEQSGYCVNQAGNPYFELPQGDYRILITKFKVPGEVGIEVTTARPVVFRGELHVMSAFERQTRQRADGTSLATFLAFLFIIPTMMFELRSFLRQ